jgi:hypothetical protein
LKVTANPQPRICCLLLRKYVAAIRAHFSLAIVARRTANGSVNAVVVVDRRGGEGRTLANCEHQITYVILRNPISSPR